MGFWNPGHLQGKQSWRDWLIIAHESAKRASARNSASIKAQLATNWWKLTFNIESVRKRADTNLNNSCEWMNWAANSPTSLIVYYVQSQWIFRPQNAWNADYYSNDKSTCPDKVRFAEKENFPTEVIAWIPISSRGLSKTLIRPSKSEAINSDICINECLKKRLPPFIHKHHSNMNYMSWPDLASSHYLNATVGWMYQNVKSNTPNQKLLGLIDSKSVRRRLGSQIQAAVDSPHRVQDKNNSIWKCGETHDRGQEQIKKKLLFFLIKKMNLY